MITFVTHLRYDNDDRLKNLETIINYYSANLSDIEFIFVEDDKEHNKIFDTFPFIKGITSFYFIKNDNVYHRTHALNFGIKMAKADIVVSLDADCIVPIDSIKMCEKAIIDGAAIAWPFNGCFIDVNSDIHNTFINTNYNYNTLLSGLDKQYTLPLLTRYNGYYVRCTNMNGSGHVGGAVMFNKNSFIAIGGYNENFIGWGYEDNDVVTRLNKLNFKNFRDLKDESICFHLFHKEAIRAENPFYQHNINEIRKIDGMSKEEIQKYISSWKQFK
jgi:predicted glycosyltransferase involved in capsule biosynthesis